MTRARFVELLDSFNELPCGICSEEFFEGELKEFIAFCYALLNRDCSFRFREE